MGIRRETIPKEDYAGAADVVKKRKGTLAEAERRFPKEGDIVQIAYTVKRSVFSAPLVCLGPLRPQRETNAATVGNVTQRVIGFFDSGGNRRALIARA